MLKYPLMKRKQISLSISESVSEEEEMRVVKNFFKDDDLWKDSETS